MPLYEYECQECGAKFEVLQRVKERPLKKAECDECGEVQPVRRLVSAPAFQFKGEGWYVTDYAKKDKKGRKGGSSDGASESSSDAGSESKKSSGTKGESGSKSKSESGTSKKSDGKQAGGD